MPSALAWWKPKASTRPAWRKATFANNLRRKPHSAVAASPRTLRRPPSPWPPRKRPGSGAKRCASQAVCDTPPPRRPASFIYRGGGPGIVPPRHRRGRQHAPRSDLSASKDGFRNEGGHDVVRHVHHVADAQIRRDAAEHVRLLAGPASLLEQVDHVEQRVPAGEREVLTLVHSVLTDRHAHGRDAPLRRCPFRWREVTGVREVGASERTRGSRALQHAEAHGDGRAHLNGGDTHLAVALSEVAVAG